MPPYFDFSPAMGTSRRRGFGEAVDIRMNTRICIHGFAHAHTRMCTCVCESGYALHMRRVVTCVRRRVSLCISMVNGKHVCAQCLQTVHRVYKLSTVSTCMPRVDRLYSGKRICAQCLQAGAQCLHVCMYMCIRIRVYVYTCTYTCIHAYVYANTLFRIRDAYTKNTRRIHACKYAYACAYVHLWTLGTREGQGWLGGF